MNSNIPTTSQVPPAEATAKYSGANRVFLTQPEAAAYLRLSPRTLERHRVAGTGSVYVKLGRRVLYRRSDLDDWAASRTFGSTSEAEADAATAQRPTVA